MTWSGLEGGCTEPFCFATLQSDQNYDRAHEKRGHQIGDQGQGQRGPKDRSSSQYPQIHDGACGYDSDGERKGGFRLLTACACKSKRNRRGRNKSAEQAQDWVPTLRAYEATRHVADEAQSGKQEYKEPELARPDSTKRTIRAIRQQRKDDNRHHREADASSQTRVVDAGYHRMQP